MEPLTIKLKDGRTLAWTQYGAIDGDPVVVLDGPGSRGLARAVASAAEENGVRLLAPDRPGFLGSSPKPGRTIADYPADLAEMADAAGAETFGILAQSGGTPYALAVAAAMPERVRALAFTGGIMPFGEPGALDDVGGPMLGAFRMGRRAPWLLRRMMRVFARNPQKAADRALKDLAPKDAEQLKDPAKLAIHVDTTAEIMSYTDEMVNEIKLLWQPWPVDFGAIRAPVSLWWGDHDVTHPEMHSRWLSKHLGNAPVHVVKDAATFGLFEVFPDVVRFAAASRPSRDAPNPTRTQ